MQQSHLCSMMSEQPIEVPFMKIWTHEYDISALHNSKLENALIGLISMANIINLMLVLKQVRDAAVTSAACVCICSQYVDLQYTLLLSGCRVNFLS